MYMYTESTDEVWFVHLRAEACDTAEHSPVSERVQLCEDGVEHPLSLSQSLFQLVQLVLCTIKSEQEQKMSSSKYRVVTKYVWPRKKQTQICKQKSEYTPYTPASTDFLAPFANFSFCAWSSADLIWGGNERLIDSQFCNF